MPVAELIAIGTELLLGEIQDTNTRYLARALRDLGVDLYRSTVVGDNQERIAQVLREALGRSQVIITTGGLGPTIDDPTRQAVALALGVETEFRPELWEQILARFQRFNRQATENNRRQAYIPAGAIPVENPVGTAPAFICEVGECCAIICLPGVPREMETLMQSAVLPYLRRRFHLTGIIKARVLHTAGVGESMVDEWIGDLETLSNPTVGLLAHPGQIDIRITAKADHEPQADAMIASIEKEIRGRIGMHIYGADADNLEGIVLSLLNRQNLSLAVLETGVNGEITRRLTSAGFDPSRFESPTPTCGPDEILQAAQTLGSHTGATVVLAACLLPAPEKQTLHVTVLTPHGVETITRSYGGPPPHGPAWAAHTALDHLRRCLLSPQ